jgi:hypothetical protein
MANLSEEQIAKQYIGQFRLDNVLTKNHWAFIILLYNTYNSRNHTFLVPEIRDIELSFNTIIKKIIAG